jgi:small ligand-binding sensory domain FIST
VIRAGVGLGRGFPTGAATSEASRAAMHACETEVADLVVVFATPDHFDDENALVGPLAAVTRAKTVLGCSASGVIAGPDEVERESAVAVLAVTGLSAESFIEADPGPRAAAIGDALAERAMGADALVLLPDVLTFRPRAILDPLADTASRVVGAAASGVGPGPTTWQIGNDRVASRALVGARIDGARLSVGVTHAARPVGPRFTVTASEGNVIFTLDDRPAVEALRSVLPPSLAEDVVTAAASTLVAVGAGATRADHLTRSIVGIDAERGALAIGTPIAPGTVLRFAARDPARAREDLGEMLRELAVELDGRTPAFGLYFDCAGRGESFYGVPGMDSAYIASVLGSFPLLGIFGGAEIGPSAHGPDVHLFSGVLAVFS